MNMKNSDKIILDLCGGTGAWSMPYKNNGYDVRVITSPNHDVLTYQSPKNVYGILAAPPCPHFSFLRTNAKTPRDLTGAMKIVQACLKIIYNYQFRLGKDTQKLPPLKFWALENPVGMLQWFLGKPPYQFSPYEFGDMYKKRTQLWGYFNFPKKTHSEKPDTTKFDHMLNHEIHPEYVGIYDRKTRRSITPKGFAEAFYKANK